MKTIIKHNLIILSISLALTGCKKEEVELPKDDEQELRELLLIEEKIDGKTKFKFEYDSLNRMTVMSTIQSGAAIQSTYYKYGNDNHLISFEAKSNGRLYLWESYSYRNQEIIPYSGVRVNYDEDGSVSYHEYIEFTHQQNTVIETIQLENDDQDIYAYTFDEHGNQIKYQWGYTVTEYGDFDDKVSPRKNYPWHWKIRNKNNYGSVKITSNNTIIKDEKWEYTYNKAGYPVEVSIIDRNTNKLLHTREFIYKDAN